jgi:hypothetical protein
MPKKDVANDIGLWALWSVHSKTEGWKWTYEQVRPFSVELTTEITIDCSGDVDWCRRQAGAKSAYGRGYDGIGNTENLLANGQRIPLWRVKPGDVVVYNAHLDATKQHAATIVQRGKDPLTVSMGQQGDPSLVRVSQDGRPPTYLRFDNRLSWPPRVMPPLRNWKPKR